MEIKYPLATSTWSDDEKLAAKYVIDTGNCTMGKITQELEIKFANKMGVKYSVFSNSGSSANLLAVAAMFYKKDNPLKQGDEILVPAISWATTYYPLQQYGLKLKFIDVSKEDFNINISDIEDAITEKTKGIFAVNLLGMPCNYKALTDICKKHNLVLLEDNCEAMGGTYNGKQLGTYGDIGTYSTFFSHHICTVEGGFCTTNNEELYHIMISLRAHGWIRNLPDINHVYNKSKNNFEDTFKFVLPGYNLRPNDIFAAIGLLQIDKLNTFVDSRRKNYRYLKQKLDDLKLDWISIQDNQLCNDESSWFGFGFTTKDNMLKPIIDALSFANIEFRPIVAGNFTKNPVIKYMNYTIHGDLPNTQFIDKGGFFIGNNGEDISPQIDHFINILRKI
jgi:CDP-6-deoxy-D-xylo-4-hexulose-3-dehydrase